MDYPTFVPGSTLGTSLDLDAIKKSRARRMWKIIGVTIGIVAAVLAIVYFVGVMVFSSRFYPNTTIYNQDVSWKSADEVSQLLEDSLGSYSFNVTGQGLSTTLTSEQAGLTLDGDAIASSILGDYDPWQWPVDLFQTRDETEKLVGAIQSTGLDDSIRAVVDEYNATAEAPQNAYIRYNGEAQNWEVVPEVPGTMINPDKVIEQVSATVTSLPDQVVLTPEVLMTPEVTQDNENLQNALGTVNGYLNAVFDINLAGSPATTLNREQIAYWTVLNPDFSVWLNDEAIREWAQDLSGQYYTVGSTRNYTRPDGKAVSISGGDYGWSIDSETLFTMVRDGIYSGNQNPIEMPTYQTGYALPDEGGRDWGPRYVDVDISEQHARFYDSSGNIIWESDFVSGAPYDNRSTPTGVWSLNSNAGSSTLIGYKPDGTEDYRTPVDYWMPFVGNSVGFHDANWQAAFGGTRYKDGYGSHGCVNLPPSAAADLHSLIEVGDVVVTHY